MREADSDEDEAEAELAQLVEPLVRAGGSIMQAARQKGGVWFPACYRAFVQRRVPLDTPTMRYVFCGANVAKYASGVRLELLQLVPAAGGLPPPSVLLSLRDSLSEMLLAHIQRHQRAARAPPPPPPPPPALAPLGAALEPDADPAARAPASPRGELLPGESALAARALLELEARASAAAAGGGAAASPLEQTMVDLLAARAPSAADEGARARALALVRRQARALWDAHAEPFGSTVTGLHAVDADLDVCVLPTARGFGNQKRAIFRLAAGLRAAGMQRVEAITHAKVPIVKFVEPREQVACDVCLGNVLALRNTALVCAYLRLDARVRPLALAVKQWARARRINDPSNQTLSSYAYVLLVIGYLQSARPAVLPCLQASALWANAVDVDGLALGATPEEQALLDEIAYEYGRDVDAAFCADPRAARAALGGAHNRGGLGALLRGFFRWYGRDFRVDAHIVSVRRGGLIPRDERGWPNSNGHLWCIEDPFNLTHDLGRVLTAKTLARVRREFVRAADLCEDAALTFDALAAHVE